jgi:hypothetical protein
VDGERAFVQNDIAYLSDNGNSQGINHGGKRRRRRRREEADDDKEEEKKEEKEETFLKLKNKKKTQMNQSCTISNSVPGSMNTMDGLPS